MRNAVLCAGLLGLLSLASGCATEVYHETKTREQTQKDIKTCKEHGILMAPYDPIAALLRAYECLEQKGYKRGRMKAQVEGS